MHGGDLCWVGIDHVDVQGLALIDVSASVSGHVKNVALLDFPRGLVEVPNVFRNSVDALDGTFVAEDVVLHLEAPHVFGDEVANQVFVQHHEFTRKGSADIEVGCEGLKALVVAQDLGGRGGWHGSEEE